jgi:hypothetical protein
MISGSPIITLPVHHPETPRLRNMVGQVPVIQGAAPACPAVILSDRSGFLTLVPQSPGYAMKPVSNLCQLPAGSRVWGFLLFKPRLARFASVSPCLYRYWEL